jgi:stearoyl-CoA desaturase (delta-9 desaturase)
MRPHEIDMGWAHLKLFAALGLAKIRRVATRPELGEQPKTPDLESLRAIIVHRMHVLRHYTHNVTLPVLRREVEPSSVNPASVVRGTRRLLSWQPSMLDESSRQRLSELVERHPRLKTVLEFRNELKSLWEGAHTSNERLLADFREWCTRAETSGIQALEDFAGYLKSFRALPAPRRA